MAANALGRHSIRGVSQYRRLAPAPTLTPPLWTTRDSSSWSSNPAQSDHDTLSDDAPGTVTGGLTAPASTQEEFDAEVHKVEDPASRPRVLPAQVTPRRPPQRVAPRQGAPRAGAAQRPLKKPYQVLPQRRPTIAPDAREYLRFARIFGLSPETTLADILAGIAATAPVGRVLDVSWEKKGRLVAHRGRDVRGAYVLFDHDAAPVDLVRLAKQRAFRVRGAVVHVSVWAQRAFHGNVDAPESSRVLCVRGPRDVEDFSEEGIRGLLMGNADVVKALGSLGLDAEAVETTDWGGVQRMIEWRFFSNEKQCRVIVPVLRRYFHKQLSIGPGPDPCWNERLYPWERTGTHDVRYLSGVAEANKAPGPRRRFLSDEENTLAPQEMTRYYNTRQFSGDWSREQFEIDWEDREHWVDREPRRSHTRTQGDEPKELEPISWEHIKYGPSHIQDIDWEQDEVPWEEAKKDDTADPFHDILAQLQAEDEPEAKPQLKNLGTEQMERVGVWMQAKKMAEKRYKPK